MLRLVIYDFRLLPHDVFLESSNFDHTNSPLTYTKSSETRVVHYKTAMLRLRVKITSNTPVDGFG